MCLRKIIRPFLSKRSILWIQKKMENYKTKSLIAAAKAEGFTGLMEQLKAIVPDIRHQYTLFDVDSEYLERKVRGQHCFQITLVNEAMKLIAGGKDNLTIVDIGDSSGTHIRYLQGLYKDRNIRFLSVNIDKTAVEKIKAQGLEAVHCRAEELTAHSINADIFMSFEMLEHLMDPLHFLHDLSEKTACKALVITIPYRAESRVGLHHIRKNEKRNVTAENAHVFELTPSDWRLFFAHAGWSIKYERIYLQYPRNGFWRIMKGHWRQNDFEGFYGVILERDKSWSKLYSDW